MRIVFRMDIYVGSIMVIWDILGICFIKFIYVIFIVVKILVIGFCKLYN